MHAEDHEMIIKTPKQLIVTVVLSFVIPVVVLIMLASWVTTGDRKAAGSDALGPEATALRIAPVAKIELVDASGPVELRSGEQVYALACAACHDSGAAGAHKFGDQVAWSTPIGTGLETMINNVIKGKGAMPARGGNPNLQDIEIARAVVYMSNAAGGNFEEPAAEQTSAAPATTPAPAPMAVAAAPAAATSAPAPAPAAAPAPATNSASTLPAGIDLALGEKIYNQACMACHRSGVAGAPKLGDKAAWAPYVATGMDTMIELAIKGKGAMPPRGGMMNASDNDIASAVHYMVQSVQ
ncbi:cytochrome c5 family protein [Orrella daihaiensis]|uniref:Cytochrome c5 family protein n=2 Tax=Orrella daihaiensis TaxID=2782176 RepID=A0ABY4ANS4_9BURK|nr:cytochrome c5 family protein [Orrella daihaiensis]